MSSGKVTPIEIASDPTRLKSLSKVRNRERGVFALLGGSAGFSIFITFAIVAVLGVEMVTFFTFDEVSITEFFFTAEWNPDLGGTKHFGIWPLISGTLLIAGIALLIAVPLGLVTAIYLSEYAHPKVRSVLKPALEILAGIPTVVYGFFALSLITPVFRVFDGDIGAYAAGSAGIAVGILILPIVSSLSEDALRAVPQSLRDGVYGLGGTKFDAAVKVVTPAALSGIVSAVLLAAARAVGETMIVALAAGSKPTLTLDPTSEVQTITGHMVSQAFGDVSSFDVGYYSIYAVAAVLFVMTLSLTLLGTFIRRKFREAYE